MEMKSTVFSSPKVTPQMSPAQQPNNLVLTGSKLERTAFRIENAELVREQRLLAENMIDDDVEGGQQ